MIVVIETIKALDGKINELKEALITLAPISRKAKGCLQYDILEPLVQTGEILVLMRFEKLAYLRQHESSDYIAEFVKNYNHILYDEVTVTEWKELPIQSS